MIEAYEYRLLNDYLEQDWDEFISFAETQGFDANEVYQLLNKLEEKANG